MQSSIARSSRGYYGLRLEGRCSNPQWVVSLFSGLTHARVSVISGWAIRNDKREWEANFLLDFRRSSDKPEALDYVSMTRHRLDAFYVESPRLHRFAVVRTPDQSLEVTLEGPDQIGFLCRLLTKLNALALFPTEMDIDTLGGTIRDRIVLRGLAGAAPSEATRQTLELMLGRLVPNREAQSFAA